jgi:dihydropteroate synthase
MPNNSSDNIMKLSTENKLVSGSKVLDISKPLVMGILNLTPDSFYTGSRNNGIQELLNKANKHLSEGASILDIGAVSTRPGAKNISEEKEIERLLSYLQILRGTFPDCWISADTWRSNVAEVCLKEGTDIINDISGGTFDANMLPLIAKDNTPYVMMHIKGEPHNMQLNPTYYIDVVSEVYEFFETQIQYFTKAGATQLILDPGYGFGKTLKHNYQILKNTNCFLELGYPMLAGVSRKSMIYNFLDITAEEALNGTNTVNTLALFNGTKILRVHDVKEAMETIKIVEMYNSI